MANTDLPDNNVLNTLKHDMKYYDIEMGTKKTTRSLTRILSRWS